MRRIAKTRKDASRPYSNSGTGSGVVLRHRADCGCGSGIALHAGGCSPD